MARTVLKLMISWKITSSVSQLHSARLPCLKSICLLKRTCKSTLRIPAVTCGYMQRVENVSHPVSACSGWDFALSSRSYTVNKFPFGDLLSAGFFMGFVLPLRSLFKKSPKTSAEMYVLQRHRRLSYASWRTHTWWTVSLGQITAQWIHWQPSE